MDTEFNGASPKRCRPDRRVDRLQIRRITIAKIVDPNTETQSLVKVVRAPDVVNTGVSALDPPLINRTMRKVLAAVAQRRRDRVD